MKFPLASTVQIAGYVAKNQRSGQRYPLVLMLEPTLACNIACIGCGKIREYESNKARLSVEECIDAGVQCPAPVVSICGGEPLVFKGIEDVVHGFMELKKNVELCTNALRLEQYLDVFEPSKRLTFVVHLDGMQEIHDYICDYPGLWDIAVGAIVAARAKGFRVTTNTTIFKETQVEDVIQMMDYLTNEIGIDGMLVAPGYQYSQIDPNLTMTRDEHEEKFRAIRAAARKNNYRWLASPIYQDFLAGDRKLPCAPWGSITRNPYGWKGPCYLLTDGIFPTYDALMDGIEWDDYGPGNDPRCEHCGIHSGFEPSAAFAAAGNLKETVRSAAWTLTG
jgi:hopanoid biosynthesis associated radical SAM protein HpnH